MTLRGTRYFVVCLLLALAMSGGAGPVLAQEGLTPDLVGTALTGHAFQFITKYGTVGHKVLWKYDDAKAKWASDGRSFTIEARVGLLNTKETTGNRSSLMTQRLTVIYDPDTKSIRVEQDTATQGDSVEASWEDIKKEFPDDEIFSSGNPATPQSTAAAGAGFSGAVPNNWDATRTKDSLFLKRKTAKAKSPCGWEMSVSASITAKAPARAQKPKDAAEALALAEASFKARRQGATPNDMAVGLAMVGGREGASSFAMGDFKGAIADFALWLRRGSWGGGYTGESFGCNGAGQVVRNGEVIEFSYGASGSGCWDNSSRSYLVTQGVAAQEEARAILASLRWDGKNSLIKAPYLGPKYDGSDLPKVVLNPATIGKLQVGETATIEATVPNIKPEDQPLTFNWSGTFEGTPESATSSPVVHLLTSKPGKYKVNVGVDGKRFGIGGGSLEYEVVAASASNTSSSSSSNTSKTTTAPERRIVQVSNYDGVSSGPTAPTVLTFHKNWMITFIQTYHWNGGRGTSRPGTIALRDGSGKVYGPWNASGAPGQGGVPNAYWEVRPNFALPPGTYTVIDSDPTTWAQNAASGGRGFIVVRGHERPPKP